MLHQKFTNTVPKDKPVMSAIVTMLARCKPSFKEILKMLAMETILEIKSEFHGGSEYNFQMFAIATIL